MPAKAGIQSWATMALRATWIPAFAGMTFVLTPLHAAEPQHLRVATFDSGFGGFFTAKSIEQASRDLLRDYEVQITIRHYGDTKNLPYGEKSPEQIAALGSAGVIKALSDGADLVFIACNTASTQYDKIKKAVEQKYPGRSADVVSIIESSAARAKQIIDRRLTNSSTAQFAVLATPATVKNMAYPRQIAALYNTRLREQPPKIYPQERWFKQKGTSVESATQESMLNLANGKTVHLYQVAPANWVDLIEHGGNLKEKNQAVKRDLNLLFSRLPEGAQLDGAGYFCTHYPVLDKAIRLAASEQKRSGENTAYVTQGELMAAVFRDRVLPRLKTYRRTKPVNPVELERLIAQSRASVTLSSDHVEATRRLARTMFPGEPEPAITVEDFAPGVPDNQQVRRKVQ